MAEESRTILKTYFETGDIPTEAQFINFLDSYFHKDDIIPAENVEDLAPIEEVISGSGNYQIAAGKLLIGIVLVPSISGSYTIGTTGGGDEIDSGSLTAGTNETINYQEFFGTATSIYFTGTFTAKIYLR